MSGSKWVDFHSVEGILLLRLMSRCNERCVFCMVEDEIEQSDDVPCDAALDAIRAQPPGTIIEFFGGEPTIYPKFLELLREARRLGFDCSIATNARIFHSAAFTEKVAATGVDHLYIRTSLYGDTPELHDALTRTPNSYVQTAKGMANVLGHGILTQVNIVIMKENYLRLSEMVKIVRDWGVPKIKFGNLISLATCMPHAVRLSEVKPHLEAAIEEAESYSLSVTVEKTPLCCAGGRIDLLSTEREAFGGRRAFDETGACANCVVARWCDGLDPDYAHAFGYDDLTTMTHVPRTGLIDPVHDLPEPELLKSYCVVVDENDPAPDLADKLAAILPRVRAKHGRFAIFPETLTFGGAHLQRA